MSQVQGYSTKVAAKVTGATPRQLQIWDETGLLKPSIQQAYRVNGVRRDRLYSYLDLVAIRAISQLRNSVSLQKLRQVHERLLSYGRSFTDTRLLILGDEIFFPVGKEQLVALLDKPGQLVMYPLIVNINLEVIEQEIIIALAKVA
jgi:hypothetical protein